MPSLRDFLHRVAAIKSKPGVQLRDLLTKVGNLPTISEAEAQAVVTYPRWRDAWLLTEASVYEMFMRGHAPNSQEFRRWVAEEVLPSIRKTGKYDAE